jgi:hypothetical protein
VIGSGAFLAHLAIPWPRVLVASRLFENTLTAGVAMMEPAFEIAYARATTASANSPAERET